MHSAHPNDPDCDDEIAFHERFGGAIIDEDGREIPITEEMVQAACHALEEQSFSLHGRNPAH